MALDLTLLDTELQARLILVFMDEASKTKRIRPEGFSETYLKGRLIDIGCGPDPIEPFAEPFDQIHGDANTITRFREPLSYDAVHSSHCLEHMKDPVTALAEWSRLLKPGGYMIIVVPDERLYEQGIWPSIFNEDHKHSFRIGGNPLTPVSVNIHDLIKKFPELELVESSIQDAGLNHSLLCSGASLVQKFLARIVSKIRYKLVAIKLVDSALDRGLCRFAKFFGIPVDQTYGRALAQIQIIVRKKPT